MTIKELKTKIESKNCPQKPLIFKIDFEDDFLAMQYLNQISTNRELPIQYIETLQEAISTPFSNTIDHLLVYKVEKLETFSNRLDAVRNLVIICQELSDSLEGLLDDILVEFPSLEEWQVHAWVRSVVPSITEEEAWKLIGMSSSMYSLQNFLDQITLFPPSDQKEVTTRLLNNFSVKQAAIDIYQLVNSILIKDLDTLNNFFVEGDWNSLNDFLLLQNLTESFKIVIMIQLNPKATSEELGLNQKRFFAIKRLCGFYSTEQLLKILEFLTDIEPKVKSGELYGIDLKSYLILTILSL